MGARVLLGGGGGEDAWALDINSWHVKSTSESAVSERVSDRSLVESV